MQNLPRIWVCILVVSATMTILHILPKFVWGQAAGLADVAALHHVEGNNCTACHGDSLLALHGNGCILCHQSTDLNVQTALTHRTTNCTACHSVGPHAMDCMLCHYDKNIGNVGTGSREIHLRHREKVACGICHFIPEKLSRGPVDGACGMRCHDPRPIRSARAVHAGHLSRFGNQPNPCAWCHGQAIPARPDNVCSLCHKNRSGGRELAHRQHARTFDCLVCHESAEDFAFDVRSTPRSRVCTVCHESRPGDGRLIHQKHLPEKAQCYACHGNANVYAATRPEKDCSICHGFRSAPFQQVHLEHAARGMMCAVCHSMVPLPVKGIQGPESPADTW